MKLETKDELEFLAEWLEEGFLSFSKKEKEFDTEVKQRRKEIVIKDLEAFDNVSAKIKIMARNIGSLKEVLDWEIENFYREFERLCK